VWLKVGGWFLTSDIGKEIKEMSELGRYSRLRTGKSVTVRCVLVAGSVLQPQGT
jgi:hypothetical protein